MPLPVILGALAALAAGTGLGTMQRKEAEKQRALETGRDVFLKALLSGTDVPDSILAQYFGKDQVPNFKMLGESIRVGQRAEREQFLNPGAGSGANLTPATPPDQMAPGDPTMATSAPSWHPPLLMPSASAEPAATAVPAPITPTVRPQPGRTLKQGNLSFTIPPTSEADVARLGMESERLGMERAKQPGEMTLQRQKIAEGELGIAEKKTKATLVEREQAARDEAAGLLRSAAELPDTDLRGRLKLMEQAYSASIKGKLAEAESISAQIKDLRERITGKALDLKDPNTAEYIMTTGKNPQTNEPVDEGIRRQATSFVKAQTERKQEQARVQAQTIASIQSAEYPKRLAIGGSIKTLVKEGENVSKVRNTADRIQGALKVIEQNMDAFPTVPVIGQAAAMTEAFLQTERGQKIKQIQQAITLLQSIEARQLAGEQGRIANQIEQQWRNVQADPTRVTKATAQKLMQTSRQLTADLLKTNVSTVQKNAKAARGAGVPSNLVDAFAQGDLDVLRSTLGEGLTSGAIPTTITIEDLK